MSEIEKKSIDMKEHEYYVVLNNNLPRSQAPETVKEPLNTYCSHY